VSPSSNETTTGLLLMPRTTPVAIAATDNAPARVFLQGGAGVVFLG